MRALFLCLSILALGGCGASHPELDGPCQATCDCTQDHAPIKCPGEWTCNAQKTCEYVCRPSCEGAVYTCPDGTDCQNGICTERAVVACQ